MKKTKGKGKKKVLMKKDSFVRQELFFRFLVVIVVPTAYLLTVVNIDAWMERVPLEVTIILAALLAMVLFYFFSKPYLDALVVHRAAQRKLEAGDFSVRIDITGKEPVEVRRIATGFNKIVTRTEELVAQIKQVAEEQRIAELSALEAQIDPHFLYNTLDAINWKAIENEQYEISELIGALADIFRKNIKNSEGMMTLETTMECCKKYIYLQSVKLGKEPKLIVRIPEELKQIRLHKLLMQPFIENALKYAFVEKDEECILMVEVKRSYDQLHIIIADNGIGIKEEMLRKLNNENEEMEGHVGISNVRKRLKLYYGEDSSVYFESVENCYTRAHLFLSMFSDQEEEATE